MLDDPDTVELSFWLMVISAAALIMVVFLFVRRSGWAELIIWSWRRRSEIQWTGKGFDPGAVAGRLAQVRKDYVRALNCRPRPRFHSRALLSASARVVRACPYWQNASVTKIAEEQSTDVSRNQV